MLPELKFAVLGPVRAWRGEAELSLGAPQQRAVLAMLLLAGGRHVTLSALVGGLWEGEPPLAAAGTVRTYVSRLRGGLKVVGGDSAAGAIESAGTGYSIPAGAGTVDLDVFQQMVADARALKSGGLAERAQAASMLRDALRLGQGEPLADVPGPHARYQRARITELRLAVTEERLALEIEAGAHVVSAAELQALLAEYPMRERISELLMLALYRSGRRVDALAVFDSTRRLLAGEYGVEPGPSLREMHQRILRTDEGLIWAPPQQQPPCKSAGAAPSRPLAGPSGPVPAALAQLPADLPVFAGRSRELAWLDALADDGTRRAAAVTVVAIDGMAGMGKTALAVHWAYRVAGRFPDGQLYADIRGSGPGGPAMSAGEALRGFLEALGVVPGHVPGDLHAQASLYRSILRGRRVLVLLDDARDVPQVRPLLPASPGCLVIVTSRNRLPGLITAHGACSVTLEALSAQESRQALAARVGATRLAAEPLALAEIIDGCAGLPLAIAVVAARAAVYGDLPLGDIAGALRDATTRLDALGTDDPAADVRAVFSWSYQRLTGPARRLFRLLSVHWGPDISRSAAASLAGLPRTEAEPLLGELTSARLLTEHRPGRLSWHDLTFVYAAELSAAHDSPEDRDAALGRLLDYYLHTSHSACRLLGPGFTLPRPDTARPGATPEQLSGHQHAMAWLAAERQVLQAAVRHAEQHGFRAQAWHLSLTLRRVRQLQGSCRKTGTAGSASGHRKRGDAAKRSSHRRR